MYAIEMYDSGFESVFAASWLRRLSSTTKIEEAIVAMAYRGELDDKGPSIRNLGEAFKPYRRAEAD